MWEDLAYKRVPSFPAVGFELYKSGKSLAVGMYASFSLLLTVDVIGSFKTLLC